MIEFSPRMGAMMPTAEAITWLMACPGDDATVACNCT